MNKKNRYEIKSSIFDKKIRNTDELEEVSKFKLISIIPQIKEKSTKIITHEKPEDSICETFEKLKTDLKFLKVTKNIQTVLVTSAFPEEGKSFIASNLAVTFSKEGNKVLLIDSDMRAINLNEIFGIAQQGGLSNYLADIKKKTNTRGLRKDIIDTATIYIEQTNITNLDYMSSGDIPPNVSELLMSNRLEKLLDEVKQIYDIIIIDSNSCSLTTDSTILSSNTDSVILVSEYGNTGKKAFNQIIKNLNEVEANIICAVLNKAPKTLKIKEKCESIPIENLKQIKEKQYKNQKNNNKQQENKLKKDNNSKEELETQNLIIKEQQPEKEVIEDVKNTSLPKTPRKTKTRKTTNTKNKETNKISKKQQTKEAIERTNDLLESITRYNEDGNKK